MAMITQAYDRPLRISLTLWTIACSGANASYRLLCSNATQQSLHAIHTCHQRNMAILQQTLHDKLCKIRILGTIAACDVKFTHDYDTYVRPYFIRKGVIIGRLHNTLYIMPPYVITINDLEYAYHVLADAIKKYGKQS